MATATAAIDRSTATPTQVNSSLSALRWTGLVAIVGGLLMLVGALVFGAAGADLDAALDDGAITGYLVAAADQQTLLVLNLSLWIFGAIAIGVAGIALAARGDRAHPAIAAARVVYIGGSSLAVASFVIWLGLVRLAGGVADPASVEALADTLGFIASRADWVATVLLVGVAPALLVIGSQRTWVPRWLTIWSALAAAASVLTVIALFTGGLTSYGFLIVPVGIGWIIAAGVVTLRSS